MAMGHRNRCVDCRLVYAFSSSAPFLSTSLLLPFLPTLRAHVRVRADSGVVPDGRALHGSGLRSSQFGVWRLAFGFM